MAGRVLFPSTGFTTDDLAVTYEQFAPVLLPHLRDRPVTLKRYPDDVQREGFWEKDLPSFAPKRVKTLPVPRKREPGLIRYINISDPRTLRWAASIGCIESTRFCIAIQT
jgi:bifunctional non-homologous end joining protein LigD